MVHVLSDLYFNLINRLTLLLIDLLQLYINLVRVGLETFILSFFFNNAG